MNNVNKTENDRNLKNAYIIKCKIKFEQFVVKNININK